jgi:hypothetical protein
MAELEILFRTKAELAGAIAARDELERTIGKKKALNQETAKEEAQLAVVNAKLAQHSAAYSDLGAKLQNLATGALTKVVGLLGITGTGFEVIAQSIRKFAAAEVAVARLDAALSQAGQFTEAYRASLQGLAHQLSEDTAKSGLEWLSVLTRLVQFGADANNIDQYATAVKNLAGILGGNIEEAAFIFSKAMQGNVEMLSRWGIHVEAGGTKARQLDQVMQQLALRGGGQLEAQAKTLEGQMAKLEHRLGGLFRAIGQNVAQTGLLHGAIETLGAATDFWEERLSSVIPAQDGLTNAYARTKEAIEELETVAKKHHADELARIAEERAADKAMLDEQTAKRIELDRLENEKVDDQMAEGIADVKTRRAAGTITGPQAVVEERAIRQKAETRKHNIKQGQFQAEIDEARSEYGDAAAEVTHAQSAIDVQKQRIATKENFEQKRDLAASRKGALDQSKTALAKAQEDYAKYIGHRMPGDTGEFLETWQGPLDLAHKQVAFNQRSYDRAAGDLGKLSGVLTGPDNITAAEMRIELQRLEGRLAEAEKNLASVAGPYRKIDTLQRQKAAEQEHFSSQQRQEESAAAIEQHTQRVEHIKQMQAALNRKDKLDDQYLQFSEKMLAAYENALEVATTANRKADQALGRSGNLRAP